MPLLAHYQAEVEAENLNHDPLQEQAIRLLQSVLERLKQPRPTPQPVKAKGFLSFLGINKSAEPDTKNITRGVYLWGGVGRGKTWIMDMFYDMVEKGQKRRYHFHHFMESLHKALKQHPDQQDPLQTIAAEWAQETRVICFDELHLTEVANAMLLFPLLEHLQREGVILIITSNREPENLYQGQIKKELFIEPQRFLKNNMDVLHLDSGIDYREVKAQKEFGEMPSIPILTDKDLSYWFQRLSKGVVRESIELHINSRNVPIYKASDNVLWLDFKVACASHRTTSDYIWMAERYKTVMLSDVYVMTEDNEEEARRFFYMIDEFYDQGTLFLFSSTVPLAKVYQGYRLRFAFKRTLSRLLEMYSRNNKRRRQQEKEST